VSAAVAGLFMPWVTIEVREPELARQLRETTESSPVSDTIGGILKDVGRITATIRRGAETITGDLPSLSEIPRQVSGVQIPRLANRQQSKLALAIIEQVTGERQHLGLKSYAVYLLPGLALICGVLVTIWGRHRAVSWSVAGVCAAVTGAAFWKLMTMNLQAAFITITIERGLWLSLWAYAVLAVAAGMSGLMSRRLRA